MFSNVESTSLGKDVALSILQKHLVLAKPVPVETLVEPASWKVKLEKQMAAQKQQYLESVKVEQPTVKQKMLQHLKLTVQQSTLLAEVKLPKVPHGTVGDGHRVGVVKCQRCGLLVERLDWHGQHSSKDFRNY